MNTFSVYFYLTFKGMFLLLSNPKGKKTGFGVPPCGLPPACPARARQTTASLLSGKVAPWRADLEMSGLWADRREEVESTDTGLLKTQSAPETTGALCWQRGLRVHLKCLSASSALCFTADQH